MNVPGREDYASWIRAAWYSLLSSVREGQRWSVLPAGLSSDDYGRHFLATGDEQWLRSSGLPGITAIADYLTARIGPKRSDGKYRYSPAGGADEYVATSIDNALTNGGSLTQYLILELEPTGLAPAAPLTRRVRRWSSHRVCVVDIGAGQPVPQTGLGNPEALGDCFTRGDLSELRRVGLDVYAPPA